MNDMSIWDDIAIDYDKEVGETGDIYHKTYLNPLILKLLGNIKNKRILDLACGNGYFSRLLKKKGALVTGIDFSKELIKIAKNKSQGINFYVNKADKLINIKSNSQDLIVSNMAFHDIKNIKGTIKECARVLKNNGSLIASFIHFLRSAGKKESNNDDYYIKIKNYLSERVNKPTNTESVYSKYEWYHRPISYYFKELINNGFVITYFDEISVIHSKGKIIKNDTYKKFKKEIPLFIIIKARKELSS